VTPGEHVLVLLPLPGAVCLWGRECVVVAFHEQLSHSFGEAIYSVKGRDGRIAFGPGRAFLRLNPAVAAMNLILGGKP